MEPPLRWLERWRSGDLGRYSFGANFRALPLSLLELVETRLIEAPAGHVRGSAVEFELSRSFFLQVECGLG